MREPMSATEKVVLDLLKKGVPMAVIEESFRLAARKVAAEIVADLSPTPSSTGAEK